MKLQILPIIYALIIMAVTEAFFSQPGLPIEAKWISTKCAMTIVSPFANSEDGEDAESGGESISTATYTPLPSDDEPLDLTWDNVDMVLEEMRPYLLQDGGNVAISEIDGPIVRLELQV